MVAKRSTKATNNNASKGRAATKKISDKEKATKEKPTITVTENSSPEEIIHSSWSFLSTCQFFNTFHTYFQLPVISIEKLEKALLKNSTQQEDQDRLNRESSVSSHSSTSSQHHQDNFLAGFMMRIISPLLSARAKSGLSASNYESHLSTLFPDFGDVPFTEMAILDKIGILKSIELTYMESTEEKFVLSKNENPPETMRVESLGVDYEGWTYWYFGDTRLYREVPIPNGKRGTDMVDTTDFTFQLVCSTVEEWHATVKKFQPSKRTSCKELATKIADIGLTVIEKLEAREAARLRNEAKLKRQMELDLIPKKRSRRLEVKFDEEAKRQKILEIAKQQAELEEIERRRKINEMKLLAEQEKKDMRVEEARMINEVQRYITDIISKGIKSELEMKGLRNQLQNKATREDTIKKMQGWINLLDNEYILELKSETAIYFIEEEEKGLENILLKNSLRVYLMTLMKFDIEQGTKNYGSCSNIHKKLVLNRYENLADFSMDFNNFLISIDDEFVQNSALRTLVSIFNPEQPPLSNNEENVNMLKDNTNEHDIRIDKDLKNATATITGSVHVLSDSDPVIVDVNIDDSSSKNDLICSLPAVSTTSTAAAIDLDLTPSQQPSSPTNLQTPVLN